jgi:hypothetical protein
MTPHTSKDSSRYDPSNDRRDNDRHPDAAKGIWFRRLKPSEILAAVTLCGLLVGSMAMLSTRFGPVAIAIETESRTRAADVARNSGRIDSLSLVITARFSANDDRLTFMSYLLCEQSQAHALPAKARQLCDTIISKRLNP